VKVEYYKENIGNGWLWVAKSTNPDVTAQGKTKAKAKENFERTIRTRLYLQHRKDNVT